MSNQFAGKTAIISGGAGGIGFALARELGLSGMNIVIADIDSAELSNATTRLESENINTLACELDVTEYTQWESVVNEAESHFGAVNMVINNAGVGGIPGTIENTNLDTWKWVADVNMMGVLYGTTAATPAIKRAGNGGWIINVASMAGMNGVPYSSAYAATKAAVVSMSESWAVELKSHNIQVSVLCPAFVKTRIHESLRNLQDKYKSNKPIGDPKLLKSGLEKVSAMVESGIPAELLAKRVVEAIEQKQLYIFTHPNYRSAVAERGKGLDRAFENAAQSPLVKHLIDDELVSL